MAKISSPAMMQWQLDRLIGQLMLLGDHYADGSCPCSMGYSDPSGTYVSETCIPKHLLACLEYANETSVMTGSDDLRGILIDLADEVRQIRQVEIAKICGKEADQLDITDWSRDKRKLLEPHVYSLACQVKTPIPQLVEDEADPEPETLPELNYHVLAPAPAPPTVKISGKCEDEDCKIKVRAEEKVERTITDLGDLPDTIDEVLNLFAQTRREMSSRTFALGSTGLDHYEFDYQIVEAEDLKASHDPFTFEPNPDFPPELQPRLRGRAATKLQVNKMAANLDPDSLLTEFQSLDRGAPIIGPDNAVESGNGRVMAIKKAVADYPDVYARYREELIARADRFGITSPVTYLVAPILIRRRISEVDRDAFVQEANAPATIESSAIEKARKDAEKISPAMLSQLEFGDTQGIEESLRTIRNRYFINEFLGKMPENEQARFVDSHGEVSQEGIRRIVMALFVSAFPGDTGLQLAERFFESIDVNVRNTFNGIAASLASLAKLEALIRTGVQDEDLSLGNDLASAVTVFSAIKKTPGMTVEKYLAQSQMLDRELNDFQELILSVLDKYGRSGKKIGNVLRGYANLVINQPPPAQGSFMDIERPTKEMLFDQAMRLAEEEITYHVPLFPDPVPAPAPGLQGEVCRGIQQARDTHIHFLGKPPDPKTGDHAWHRHWIEVYDKTLTYCNCHAPAPAVPDQGFKHYGQGESARPFEVSEPDFIEKQLAGRITQYERGIEVQETVVANLGPRVGWQRRSREESTLKWWKETLAGLRSGSGKIYENHVAKYRKLYLDSVKKAISTGKPVPAAVIAQHPEFRTAADNRERYEKGWHTSFSNRSIAINETMRGERGFKVKRQDGKEITPAQIQEITQGVDEVESIWGNLHDLFLKTDLTIAHTSGKYPFLSQAGGLYHLAERSISIGIGSTKALAHELTHWLDHEAGRSAGKSARVYKLSTGRGYDSTSWAEADRHQDTFIEKAKWKINKMREVRELFKTNATRGADAETKDQIQQIRVHLSPYWREHCEVWARLVEQYTATQLGKAGKATDSPELYQRTPGWWTAEDFAELEPEVVRRLHEQLETLRGSSAVPERDLVPVEAIVATWGTQLVMDLPAPPPAPSQPDVRPFDFGQTEYTLEQRARRLKRAAERIEAERQGWGMFSDQVTLESPEDRVDRVQEDIQRHFDRMTAFNRQSMERGIRALDALDPEERERIVLEWNSLNMPKSPEYFLDFLRNDKGVDIPPAEDPQLDAPAPAPKSERDKEMEALAVEMGELSWRMVMLKQQLKNHQVNPEDARDKQEYDRQMVADATDEILVNKITRATLRKRYNEIMPSAIIQDPAVDHVLEATFRLHNDTLDTWADITVKAHTGRFEEALDYLGWYPEDVDIRKVWKSSGKPGTSGEISAGWGKYIVPGVKAKDDYQTRKPFVPLGREIWQIPLSEFQYLQLEHFGTVSDAEQFQHEGVYWRPAVEAAIQAGKPVPVYVLAESSLLRHIRDKKAAKDLPAAEAAPADVTRAAWFAQRMDECAMNEADLEEALNWKPLRDFLAWGIGHGQVKICPVGMIPGTYQVAIADLDTSQGKSEASAQADRVPGSRRVFTPYNEVVYEVIIPDQEPGELTWHIQEVKERPRSEPGEQQSFFDMIPAPAQLTKNVRSNLRHKIYMALILGEKSGMPRGEPLSLEMVQSLRQDAETIVDMIAGEYLSKDRAGALWLAKQMKDTDWLAIIQEKSWETQRLPVLAPA